MTSHSPKPSTHALWRGLGASRAGRVCPGGSAGRFALLIFAGSEQFTRGGGWHYVEPGDVGERQGPDSCSSDTTGKALKAVTQQTILIHLRGPAGHPCYFSGKKSSNWLCRQLLKEYVSIVMTVVIATPRARRAGVMVNLVFAVKEIEAQRSHATHLRSRSR